MIGGFRGGEFSCLGGRRPNAALQFLQFSKVVLKNDYRTRDAVMVPAPAVADLETLVPFDEAMSGVGLAVVGFLNLIDFDANEQ